MLARKYIIGGIAGFVFGVLAAIPSTETPHHEIRESAFEQRADETKYEPVGRTSIAFQRLYQTGQHEYTGEVNGKRQTYNFKLEQGRIDISLDIRKK